jgi:hypothetical protein
LFVNSAPETPLARRPLRGNSLHVETGKQKALGVCSTQPS